MIIVSQDKRSIVNFEKVKIININRSDLREIEAYFNCDEVKSNDNILLGTYETEERAKEVLQEIIKTHKISESYKYTRDVGLQSALTADIEMRNLILFRYEMPEE